MTSVTGERGNARLFGKNSLLGYANPRVAELLERAAASMNPEERDRIYRELWPIFQEELPMTPLYPARWTHVVHRRVRGLSSPFRADPLWYAEELWLEEEGPRPPRPLGRAGLHHPGLTRSNHGTVTHVAGLLRYPCSRLLSDAIST
ncbi:MAG TPA: hypothetical protein VEY33_04940 [Gemmatimonadota bacterium]|nr:hypothetical protein [Gemmatimonadota bacterium]